MVRVLICLSKSNLHSKLDLESAGQLLLNTGYQDKAFTRVLLSLFSELELAFSLSRKLLLKSPKQTVRLMNRQITVFVCREVTDVLLSLLQNFS